MRLIPSRAIISQGFKKKSSRPTLLDCDLIAWRWVCNKCYFNDLKFVQEHQELNNGLVIVAGTQEWAEWCQLYPDIAMKYDLGLGKDQYQQPSLFKTIKEEHAQFMHGKEINIDMFEFFVFDDENKNENEDANCNMKMTAEQYDVSKARWTGKEFIHFIDWMIAVGAGATVSKLGLFKKKKLSEYQRDAGYPYRSPQSYVNMYSFFCFFSIFFVFIHSYFIIFSFNKLIKDKDHKHNLFKSATVKTKWKQFMKTVDADFTKRYDVAKGKGDAVKAAETGSFVPSSKKKAPSKGGAKGFIDDKLKNHNKGHRTKAEVAEQRLEISQKMADSIQNVGHSISMMGMDDDDVWEDLQVFLDLEYQNKPGVTAKNLKNITSNNKGLFVKKWKTVIRRNLCDADKQKIVDITLERLKDDE